MVDTCTSDDEMNTVQKLYTYDFIIVKEQDVTNQYPFHNYKVITVHKSHFMGLSPNRLNPTKPKWLNLASHVESDSPQSAEPSVPLFEI